MHSEATVDAARALWGVGVSPRDISQWLGVPLGTVQHWCRGDRRRPGGSTRRGGCPRCHPVPLDEGSYAYLLGYYLGDGHITVGRRDVAALSLYCADEWPGVRREVQEALRGVMPSSGVCGVARRGCRQVKSYSTHWICLFPQHGPGRKHTRTIALEPWQSAVVDRHPGRLLRGLFHSDGCRVQNWARQRTAGGIKRYEYPRYLFLNKSEDILRICESTLDRVGVEHRRSRWDTISVAQRAAVAALDEFVGPKS